MAKSDLEIKPASVAVPVLALITIILDIPPLAWHIRNRNLAASILVSWIVLSNIMNTIDALIWPTDNIFSWWDGSGLCDIEAKLMLALPFGCIGALVCTMRSLARVLDTKRTALSSSRAERRWQMVIEYLLCFGGPIYAVAIHYIVQPNRYYVFAISGCTASLDNSWPTIALLLIWPPILCLVVVYYSVLVIIRMHRYRKDFSEILSCSDSNMTKSRFLRLFILSMTLIAVVFPTQIYVLYRNAAVHLLPYSWDQIHGPDWSTIQAIPTNGVVIFDRWIQIAVGFVLFPFFGLGQDAKKMYRGWLLKIGCGRIFPSLDRQSANKRSQTSLTSSRTNAFGSRVRLLFHKKEPDRSMSSWHSHRSWIPPSVATLSPDIGQTGFGSLPTIAESGDKAQNSPNSPLSPMLEKPSIQSFSRREASWSNKFLAKTHLSRFLHQNSRGFDEPKDLESQPMSMSDGAQDPEK